MDILKNKNKNNSVSMYIYMIIPDTCCRNKQNVMTGTSDCKI